MAQGGGGGAGGSPSSPAMTAMSSGQTSYFIQPPPLPPVKQGGKWYPWEEIFGTQPLIEVQIPEKTLETLTALAACHELLGKREWSMREAKASQW